VHAIVCERIGKDKSVREGGAHGEQIFVSFKNELFGHGQNLAGEICPHGKAASAEVAAAQTEKAGAVDTVETKPTFDAWRDGAFVAVIEGLDEGVANHAGRGVGRKSVGNFLQFALGPPVVAIEKNDDVAAAFGNSSVEGGSLATVFLADKADVWFKLADDFWSFVSGTVVHHDDFKLLAGKLLVEHTAQRLFNEAFVIIRIDEYAEKHVEDSEGRHTRRNYQYCFVSASK